MLFIHYYIYYQFLNVVNIDSYNHIHENSCVPESFLRIYRGFEANVIAAPLDQFIVGWVWYTLIVTLALRS